MIFVRVYIRSKSNKYFKRVDRTYMYYENARSKNTFNGNEIIQNLSLFVLLLNFLMKKDSFFE